MPHKHRRDKTGDKVSYELPPTTFAKPLPVAKHLHPPSAKTPSSSTNKTPKRPRPKKDKNAPKDDTPRAFARLMAFHTLGIKPPSGLDNGPSTSKKRKRAPDTTANPILPLHTQHPSPSIPQIQPGERMSDFSARVDAALPVSGLLAKGAARKTIPGIKPPQTRTEKKMQKMQKEWREIEARRREKLEAAKEEADADDDLFDVHFPTTQSKKRRTRHHDTNDDDDDDDDPWANVGKVPNPTIPTTSSTRGLVGLHDVVKAPPQFSKVPREKLLGVADIPVKAGSSLRRREELGRARREVVEGYRAMMMKGRKEIVVGVGD